jgi:vacuolar-type H+-ATPase subunit H
VTTAQAGPQDLVLYGPDGQALTASVQQDADWKPVRTTDNAIVWERPRQTATLERVVDEETELAREEAAATLADAQLHADRIVKAAQAEAERVTAEAVSLRTRADSEARTIREEAAAETARRNESGQRLDVWMARAVIAGAVGLTATGEYALARLAHFPAQVAWLLPFVIDVYVIQAFRRHRDIVQAIGLTIAANVIYHLAAAGMFGVTTDAKGEHHATWWLIALVASIASVILWRMHVITAPAAPSRTRQMAVPETVSDVRNGSTDGSAAITAKTQPAATANTTATVPANRTANRDAVSAPVTPRTARRGTATKPTKRAAKTTDSRTQVANLAALMTLRGSADAVTLADAKAACRGVSERTAARRLDAARTAYLKGS